MEKPQHTYRQQEIAEWFKHGNQPDPVKAAKFIELHNSARCFAEELARLLPDRPETRLALDKIQEAVAWGNSAISRDGTDPV